MGLGGLVGTSLQCFSKSVEVPKRKMFVKKDLISRLVQAEVSTTTVISYRHSQPTFPKKSVVY